MAVKEIQMGSGPLAVNENHYNRLDWKNSNIMRFNTKTREWLQELRPKLSEDGYVLASPSMLMGMLNAGSTTLGLIPANYMMDTFKMKVVVFRSSDDSTTIYIVCEKGQLKFCIELNRKSLALASINMSKEKTFFFKEGFAEFTSWFIDGQFVSQYGVETAAIRPQGKTPHDDFNSAAKSVRVALSTLSMNHVGGTMKLILTIDGVRRVWRIRYNPGKRLGINEDIQLLADGGNNPWHVANIHLEETSMKMIRATTEAERNYLYRILNPDNLFAHPVEEDIVYSKELGHLIINEIDTPRNIFTFYKRSNRAAKNSTKEKMFASKRDHGEAVKIINTVDPSTLVRFPMQGVSVRDHLIGCLNTLKGDTELTTLEFDEFRVCIQTLRDGVAVNRNQNKDDDRTIDIQDI